MDAFLDKISTDVKNSYQKSNHLLGFTQYLKLISQGPKGHMRSAREYLAQAIAYCEGPGGDKNSIFTNTYNSVPTPVFGQMKALKRLREIINNFAHNHQLNKLIVLHGPNGSAKSTLVKCLFDGVEAFSKSEEGALYCFSWIFPKDQSEKSRMGFKKDTKLADDLSSYVHLPEDQIGTIIRSEFKDWPLLLLPRPQRKDFFESLLNKEDSSSDLEALRDRLLKMDLSHKNQLIFEALLENYNGDIKKLWRHIRVERYFMSRVFRKGLVRVQAQMSVDAQVRQITSDRSLAYLPASLHHLNLYQAEGDLIDSNHGVIEFEDFLKRPLEAFKYLLATTESGFINLNMMIAHLNLVFLASTNDRQLQAFREFPDYNSFKARIELIKVPYLLKVSDEQKIYEQNMPVLSEDKELLPHTTYILALWAVLTRLKAPLLKGKTGKLVPVLEKLTPLEKALLYDNQQIPSELSAEEATLLLNHLTTLQAEHDGEAAYEGMMGASARELKLLLQLLSQDSAFKVLGPKEIIHYLKKLLTKSKDYEFLRMTPERSYHNHAASIEVVYQHWLDKVENELWDSLELTEEKNYHDYLVVYMKNLLATQRGQKIKNQLTGKSEEPDLGVLQDFEKELGVSGDVETFRQSLQSKLGAWSVENQDRLKEAEQLPFSEIYEDLLEKLKKRQRSKQVSILNKFKNLMQKYGHFSKLKEVAKGDHSDGDILKLALRTYENMQSRFAYGPLGAQEVLLELLKQRF